MKQVALSGEFASSRAWWCPSVFTIKLAADQSSLEALEMNILGQNKEIEVCTYLDIRKIVLSN